MKVCIDAGHGGFDSGAVGPSGLKEKDVNLSISLKLAEILKLNKIEVVLTRDKDENPGKNASESLVKRVEIATKNKADYFVSIHCNSSTNSSAQGTEVFYGTSRTDSKKMAENILKEIVTAMGFRNRGIKVGNFYVIRSMSMSSCLVEVAFISNPTEEKILSDEGMQNKIALSIAKGLGKTIGVEILEIKKGKVIASVLNVRKEPSSQSPIVKKLSNGEIVAIYEEKSGWYRINDGWVFAKYVDII